VSPTNYIEVGCKGIRCAECRKHCIRLFTKSFECYKCQHTGPITDWDAIRAAIERHEQQCSLCRSR